MNVHTFYIMTVIDVNKLSSVTQGGGELFVLIDVPTSHYLWWVRPHG